MIRKMFAHLLCLAVLAAAVQPARALVTVAKSGGDYTTITDALAAAGPDEEVRIIDGATYDESININGGDLIVSDPAGAVLNIGGGWNNFWGGTATIRGLRIEGAGIPFNPVSAGTMNFENVTFAGSSYQLHLGTAVTVNLTDCTFTGNWESIYIASDHQPGSVINLTNVTFSGISGNAMSLRRQCTVNLVNSTVSANAGGIVMEDTVNTSSVPYVLTLDGSTVQNCGSQGIVIKELADVTISSNSLVKDNGADGLLWEPADQDGGAFTASGSSFTGNGGRGITFANNLTATLTDCVISSNTDTGLVRYGEHVPSVDTSLTLTGCTLEGNGGFGIWAPAGTRAVAWTLTGNAFVDNGMGSLALGSTESLSNVTLTANGNTLQGLSTNSQPQAGLGFLASGSKFTNNLIDGGTGGVAVGDGSVDLLHNTIVNQGGNGVVLSTGLGGVLIANNILASVDGGVAAGTGADLSGVSVDYNLIQASVQAFDAAVGAIAGSNNITDQSAGFVLASATPGAGDYHLAEGSAAINNGAQTLGIATDMEGAARPAAGGFDRGAYESSFVPVELSALSVE